MSKKKINKNIAERCLLTEVTPYETPLNFSNWGSFNYLTNLIDSNPPTYLKDLFSTNNNRPSIPYKYKIKKDITDFRSLSLVHPKHSRDIVDFYETFDVLILKSCQKSNFSIRAPKNIAKYFTTSKVENNDLNKVEDLTAEQAYASSYFRYDKFSHLYKFFESDFFTELEKQYSKIKYLDISKCFPSLYTHSISWAFRSKRNAKENYFRYDLSDSFAEKFDALMQDFNYNETNGIVVGPEISRIFAEIILQEIDSEVSRKLELDNIKYGDDYCCCRYVDDYYVFFNDDKVKENFIRVLSNELEKFKLYLNKDKSGTILRPFITDISIKKIEISNYFSQLFDYLSDVKPYQFPKEINKIRSITKSSSVQLSSLSNFYLSCIKGIFKSIRPENETSYINSTHLLLELAFHLFRMDIRVSTSFKITGLVLDVLNRVNKIPENYRRKIVDKIYIELVNALEYSISEGGSLECMNILIVLAELGENYSISPKLVDKLIDKCKEEHDDEYSRFSRLTYFDISCFLYFIQNDQNFKQQKTQIIEEIEEILEAYNPLIYSESAYLFLDIVSCPYVSKENKNKFVKAVLSHTDRKISTQAIGRIRNFVADQTWYLNWNKKNNLRALLEKKQYLQAY